MGASCSMSDSSCSTAFGSCRNAVCSSSCMRDVEREMTERLQAMVRDEMIIFMRALQSQLPGLNLNGPLPVPLLQYPIPPPILLDAISPRLTITEARSPTASPGGSPILSPTRSLASPTRSL